jgi:Zinc dependent phospholipase C
MPGPYIHLSAMRHAAQRLGEGYEPTKSGRIPLPDASGVDAAELARLLRDHPNFASLGAIGPDLFFFLPDFRDLTVGGVRINLSSVLVGVLDFLNDVYEALDPFITKYERFLGPLAENLDEEISRLTGGLSEAVSNVLGELSSILIGLLENFATQEIAFFDFFSLGFNKGYDNRAFLWSDMLHYRKTGAFGQALWNGAMANDDDGVKAYALGYLTHMATDVTGHGLVNAIAGGPFRLHWQRHHLVENHLDSLWCLNDPLRPGSPSQYGQLTESALYFDIAFGGDDNMPIPRPPYPTGDTLRERYVRRRTLDIDSELPDQIAELLVQAMEDVYYVDGELHPQILRDNDGRPNTDLIKKTYGLLFRFLKLTTTDGFGHERPDPPELFPNLDFPVWGDPAEGSAPGDDEDDGSFWDDLLDFVLSIIKVIGYIIEVALWLGSLPWAVLADVLTYPLRLGIYYALELPLWHLFKSVRSVLVMSGYLAPMDDEIVSGLVRVGFPDPAAFADVRALMDDAFGGMEADAIVEGDNTWRDPAYPRLPVDDEFRSPWLYPRTAPELPSGSLLRPDRENPFANHFITASPHGRGADVTALFGVVMGDPNLRDRFESARTPGEADAAGSDVTPTEHLGDTVSFGEYLIWLATRDRSQEDDLEANGLLGPPPLVDWNLDADRGYGYHAWDWNRSGDATDVDPEGIEYPAPCQPPPQASGFDQTKPVLLHWEDENDPGCDLDEAGPVLLDGPDEG